MHKSIFFLLIAFLVLVSNYSFAVVVTDLSATLITADPIQNQDLNFKGNWIGTGQFAEWKFDTDGNVTDNNTSDLNVYVSTFEGGTFATNPTWIKSGTPGNFSISTAHVKTGTYSVTGSMMNGGGAVLSTNIIGPLTDISAWMYQTSNVPAQSGGAVLDLVSDANVTICKLAMRTSNIQYNVNAAGFTDLGAGVTNDFNVFRKYRIDYNSGFCDFYVYDANNALAGSALNIAHTGTIARIQLSGGVDANMYADDISYGAINLIGPIQQPRYQTHNFSTAGTKTIQLTVGNADGNTSTSFSFAVAADTNAPVIDSFDLNYLTGFGITGQTHLSAQCHDETDQNLTYLVTDNNVTQYSSSGDNNRIIYDMNNSIFNGTNIYVFTCTDPYGNSSTSAINFIGYSANFYFVFADTGVPIVALDYNFADVNSLLAKSTDTNVVVNMFGTGVTSIIYSGTSSDKLQFVTIYNGDTSPTVVQDFDIDALDSNNIAMCFSKLQPFYEQAVYSTTNRIVKINSATTGCYATLAGIDYAYLDTFKLSAYTVPGAYNLYYQSDTNVYTFLSLLAGNSALYHNLDLLILNSFGNPEVPISQDVLTASLYCQVTPDCNVLSVTYVSPETNSAVTIAVLNGSTVLTSTTATGTDANYVNFTWNFTSADVNVNFLTLRATITHTDGSTEVITKNITLRGIPQFMDPGLAVILAFGLFFFIFTLVATRYGLGWFGIIGVIAALAILSSAPSTQIILLSQTIFIVIGVFIFLTWKNETSKAI